MKRLRLRGLTLATCLFTGGVLWLAGWFQPEPGTTPGAGRFTGVADAVRPPSDLSSDQASRWRAMQPRHWRHLLYNGSR